MTSAITRAAALTRGKMTIAGELFNVREATTPELDAYGEAFKVDKVKAQAELLQACVTDDKGEPFTMADVEAAVRGSGAVTNALMHEVLTMGQKKVAMPKGA